MKLRDKKITNKSDFSENEIPDLNSLKPFEFEPKTGNRGINRRSSMNVLKMKSNE